MKKIIILLLLLLFPSAVMSEMITGGVEYTTSEAQDIILQDKPKPVNVGVLRNKYLDCNRDENIQNMLKGFTDLKDRTLAYFSDGSYGVVYKDNPLNVLYYGKNGILTHTEERTSLVYPYKSYKYDTMGNLVNMTFRVSEFETFIFNNSGNLIAHWKGENCYNPDGKIIMTRRIMK